MTRDMVDIMGSSGLAWHQWKKHGSCSGLSAAEYFAKSREAYSTIAQPKVLNSHDKLVRIPPSVIEDAFVQSNPFLERDMITITCKQGYIQEARVCLSKSLEPVPCGIDVIKNCKMTNALFPPSR
jgi:ribonuclease T2